MIESVNNDKIKYISKLFAKKYQDREKLFVVEGEHLVEEAYKNNLLKEVFVLENEDYPYESITYVSYNVMKKLTTLTTPPKIIGIVNMLKSTTIYGRVLVLDGIQDPGNMGTIIRSAVAFNIDTIVISNNSVSIYNPKVLRASEGMIFNINIVISDMNTLLKELKDDGYNIYVTDVTNGKEVHEVNKTNKMAIIIGNEGKGVREDISLNESEHLYIKMNKNCESLNVGVATSIILYELNKK